MRSLLFDEIRERWPAHPYPLMVDYADVPLGRICPAASLYSYGKQYGDRLKEVSTQPGEVVACIPGNWIHWVGMMLGCLRRGACFAPRPLAMTPDVHAWCEAVKAHICLQSESVERVSGASSNGPHHACIWGELGNSYPEDELLARSEPSKNVSHSLVAQKVWVPGSSLNVYPNGPLALVTLLRAQAEIHIGFEAAGGELSPEDNDLVVRADGRIASGPRNVK